MTAYYNEIDPYAAQWLRNLIHAGHIAPGIVDERSIEDVFPSDLRGFTQCHFFAGIGVWSHALRSAGWRDDRPVWTGSCPCQPFSAAGQGAGFDDKRHLWPHFHHLIKECQPAIVLGEQVASRDADPWIDLVCADVEALGYAFGAVPFPSAGVGAPHIRDRLYWMANADHQRRVGQHALLRAKARRRQPAALLETAGGGAADRLDDAGHDHDAGQVPAASDREPQAIGSADQPGGSGVSPGWMGDANGLNAGWDCGNGPGTEAASGGGRSLNGHLCDGLDLAGRARDPGPINGRWATADWLACRDGKWRPVEPGTFPLAHGAPARVGRLRAYGNAINAEAARVFIECVMAEATPFYPPR